MHCNVQEDLRVALHKVNGRTTLTQIDPEPR